MKPMQRKAARLKFEEYSISLRRTYVHMLAHIHTRICYVLKLSCYNKNNKTFSYQIILIYKFKNKIRTAIVILIYSLKNKMEEDHDQTATS